MRRRSCSCVALVLVGGKKGYGLILGGYSSNGKQSVSWNLPLQQCRIESWLVEGQRGLEEAAEEDFDESSPQTSRCCRINLGSAAGIISLVQGRLEIMFSSWSFPCSPRATASSN